MRWLVYSILIVLLIGLNLAAGSTGWIELDWAMIFGDDPDGLQSRIVRDIRSPAILTAILSGSALGLSGLLMQVIFQNPLAGPGVMGVSSGGALAVSIAIILAPVGALSVTILSMLGSTLVLAIILFASMRFRGSASLLILGLMIGYIISALISVLEYSAEAERLQRFIFWTLGGYHHVSWSEMPWLACPVLLAVLMLGLLHTRVDMLLLGEGHLRNLGFDFKKWRIVFFALIGVLVGVVTAFCGPLAFIGLASPHIARMMTASDLNRKMIPHVILVSIIISLVSLHITQAHYIQVQIPLNAVLSIFGAPVVIWLLIKRPYVSSAS
ncbi:MAG: iron ABC transporter permease [Flavobacteriales bacterium]|nr:iron ABC transporter permease [Flavobacteriales bacterium]